MYYKALLFIMMLCIGYTALAKGRSELDKRVETLRKMDVIQKATDQFAQAYHRIPCPADSTLAVNHINFGKELLNGINCGHDVGQNSDNIVAGAVPTRALLLSDNYMFDGWGRRILYVIDQRFTGKGSFAQELESAAVSPLTSYHFTARSTIEIRDTIGGNILNGNTDDTSIGILLSYGQNGRGAFSYEGKKLTESSSDADEIQNISRLDSTPFTTLFIKKTQINSSFDDIIHIVRRNTHIPLYCLGVDTASRIGGHTEAGPGYPAYDWPHVQAGTIVTQPCGTGYTGDIRRTCNSNGQWEPIISTCNCDIKLLTDNTSYNGVWPAATAIGLGIGDIYAQDICLLPDSTGNVVAQCAESGGWAVIQNHCGSGY